MAKERTINDLRGLLWHAVHKNHPLSPSGCSPCEAIDEEMAAYSQTKPTYKPEGKRGESK